MTTQRHSVLIVGVGSIGERHLRCFQTTGRAEVRLAEINPSLRISVAKQYGVTAVFEDLAAALKQPPEVAVIAAPAPFHVPAALRLVEAGVHMLIEKPLSTETTGIDDLQEKIAERGLVAGVAYVYRMHPLLRRMKTVLEEGRFGRPVEVVAVCGQHFPMYRPAYRNIYYNSRATGGGAIQDALTHIINAAEWLVGPVDRLVADAAHQVLEGVEVEDTVHVLARHGEVLASYSLNQHQAPNEVVLTVICERGTLRLEFHHHRWRWMSDPGGEWQEETIPPLERDTLFVAQAHAFLDAVENRTPPACTIEEGRQTLRVNLAALASIDSQTWQKVRS